MAPASSNQPKTGSSAKRVDLIGILDRPVAVSAALLVLFCLGWFLASRFISALYDGAFPALAEFFFTERQTRPLAFYQSMAHVLLSSGYVLVMLGLALLWTWRVRSVAVYLLILLAGDFYLIVMDYFYGSFMDLERDGSVPEFYQYAKELLTALLLWHMYTMHRNEKVFLALAALFGWFLLDDSLAIHENVGAALVALLSLPAVLGRPEDLGELVGVAFPMSVFLAVTGGAYFKSSAIARQQARWVAYLVAVLVAFGVFVDSFARLLSLPDMLAGLAGGTRNAAIYLEDGGEMVAMSAIVALVSRLVWLRSSKVELGNARAEFER